MTPGRELSDTVLVTGATGFVGSALATRAMAEGYVVKTLSRTNWASSPAVPVGNRFFGSLPASIPEECLDGVDAVVHCAAEAAGDYDTCHAVNVEGTTRLARMALRAGVKTFIFLSSQSARPDAPSPYGQTKYAAERSLLEVTGLNVIVLRLGLVTGPGSRGLYQRMERMVQSLPVIPLLAGGAAIIQPIHVDDLCTAVLRCCEQGPALAKVVLRLGDVEGMSLREFLQLMALTRYGHRKLMIPVPLWPVELVVRVAEKLHVALPINSNNLQGLKSVARMETREDLSRLGLTLRPLSEAI